MMSENILEPNQDRRNNICEAIKKLNTQETRFVFVDYITKDEREIIDTIKQDVKDIKESEFVERIHTQLRDDMAYCFHMDKESFSMNYGRSGESTHLNDDLGNKNPNLEEVLSTAKMHQDGAFSGAIVSGIIAALAIVGPSTVFAKYNEYLYPELHGFNRTAINEIVQAKVNQVAIFVQGESGAVHGWPFKNYENRVMEFISSNDKQISNFILGLTEYNVSEE